MTTFIPASPGELTPEWVTEAMRAAGALPVGRVTGLEVRPLTGGGTGFTGDTVRVELAYDGAADAPPSVIAKFPTADGQNRGMLESFDAYAREIRFYQRFSHRMPCPTPTFLGADYDQKGARQTGPLLSRLIDALPDRVQLLVTADVTKFMRSTSRRYALLIEDLGAESRVHDLLSPPDDAQLADVLDVLASVHAAFWGDAGLVDNDVFRPVLTTTPGLYQTVGRKRCIALAEQRWGDQWLDAGRVALVNNAIDAFADDVAALNEPVTMIHGDPRSDNILFRDDGQVVLLDWALAAHAHPAFDVGYLFSSCLDRERVRDAPALVDHYVAGLAKRGVDVDAAMVRRRVAATYRALAVQLLMSIPVLHGDSYDGEQIFDIWMPRIVAGLEQDW